MAKRPGKPKVSQQRGGRDSKITASPAEPAKKKPAANRAKPPRPVKKRDVEDIDRADSEGMAQPQAVPAERKPNAKKGAAPRRSFDR